MSGTRPAGGPSSLAWIRHGRVSVRRAVVAPLLAAVLAATACSPTTPTSAPPSAGSIAPSPGSSEPAGSAELADLIYTNGNVITMDDAQPRAEAVAVRGNRVLTVGAADVVDKVRGPDTTVVDLGGLTLVPGFIDAHQHRIGDRLKVGIGDPAGVIGPAIEQGWTTIHELYVDQSRLQELLDLEAAGTLRIRVDAYLPINANSRGGESFGDWYTAYRPFQTFGSRVRIAGLKVFTDFDNATTLLWTQDDLDATLADLHGQGWPLAIKTVSTRSLAMILRALEAIDAGPSIETARVRLEHALFVAPDQTQAIRDLGIVPVVNLNIPGELIGDPDIDAMREEEPDGAFAPWRSLFEAGIPVAGGSAFPTLYVEEPTGAPFGSPMHLLYQAVTRVGNLGVRPDPALLGEAITAEQAMRAHTIDAARASFEDDSLGSITPGKLADLVVLSDDPLAVDAEAINEIDVLLTSIDGTVEFCAVAAESLCPDGVASRPNPAPTPEPGSMPWTASRELESDPASHAGDGDLSTIWTAGAGPEQWVQVDLGGIGPVAGVSLVVSQDPAGETSHQVWMGATEDDIRLVHEFDGPTVDGQELIWEPAGPRQDVRFVRIVTTATPSWVAWREVVVTR